MKNLIYILLLLPCLAVGQAGPNSPATGANLTGVGISPWSSATSIYSSNNGRAAAGCDGENATTVSNYLKATNFSFAIPAGATINGVKVDIEKRDSGGDGVDSYVEDNIVSLVKGGTISGSNLAAAGQWSTTESYVTYGGATSMWGLSLTESDIEATTFGVVLSVTMTDNNIEGSVTAQVDHVRITVYYTEGGATTQKNIFIGTNF